ncbi:MAG: hypothetical protein WA705_16015 [Candidatus Ozemobacteraceae bacterium]|jgi:hypothetical protein
MVSKQGFIAFYALTVLFILTLVTYGMGFSNVTHGMAIQYSMYESQARQALDAGMALALRVASTTLPINAASYSFYLESGPCGRFDLTIDIGTGTIVTATVSAILFDRSDPGQECARRRGRVLIQTSGLGANRFLGGWERF